MIKFAIMLLSCMIVAPSPALSQVWLTPTDDPEIRACQQSAFSIKVGMDERIAGLTEQQAVSKWTKIIHERGGGIYELRLMVGGIKNAFSTKQIDPGLAEYIYYHCIENI